MDVNSTIANQSSMNQAGQDKMSAASAQGEQLSAQAVDDALWRMMQNNAMSKLRGYNTLAKALNDMA